MRPLALALALALALVPGCLDGISSKGVVKGTKSVTGDVRVEGGHLRVEEGASWSLTDGSLALSADPAVVVDGEIEVRGELHLREATITGLYRVVVHPTGRLVMENVTVQPSSVAATFVLAGNRSVLRGLDADVYTIHVRAPTLIADSTLRSTTLLPVVQARGVVELSGNTVTSAGYGFLLEASDALVRGNTVRAALNGTATAIAVQGGRATVENNTVPAAAVGIAFDGASGRIAGNLVRGAGTTGIAALGTNALEIAENVVEDAGRAGIYVRDGGQDTLLRGNRVSGVAGQGWSGALDDVEKASAGIALDGGTPSVQGNDVTGCENAIAVLGGTPTIRQNNLEGSTHYGILYNVSAGDRPLDVTLNWWGSPGGPVPRAPAPAPAPPEAGGERVGPGLVYAPWLAARRA